MLPQGVIAHLFCDLRTRLGEVLEQIAPQLRNGGRG